MFLFARESRYVTASNKMMFWIAIFANGLCGVLFVTGKVGVGQSQINAYYPLALTVGLVMLFCVAGMICMLYGKRTGGYATICLSMLLALGVAGITLPAKEYDLLGLAALGALNLWPTLATLFGVKRSSQQDVNLKEELTFRGSVLGKALFGAAYLLAVSTLVFSFINMVKT